MSGAKLQDDQLVTIDNLKNLGAGRTPYRELLRSLDQRISAPLMMYTVNVDSVPDSKLWFNPAVMVDDDGTRRGIFNIQKNDVSIVESYVDFQDHSIGSGIDINIVWPLINSVGKYRRIGFVYNDVLDRIESKVSEEVDTVSELFGMNSVFISGEFSIGYVDLQCTHVDGYFKTAGSVGNVIERHGINNFAVGNRVSLAPDDSYVFSFPNGDIPLTPTGATIDLQTDILNHEVLCMVKRDSKASEALSLHQKISGISVNQFNNIVVTIAIQSDGRVLVGGLFLYYSAVTNRNRLVRLNTDGTLDTDFCTNAVDGNKFSNSISTIAIQSDGKILVGGIFLNYAGTSGRSCLVRLNNDGTLDTAFCANAVDVSKFNHSLLGVFAVKAIVIQSDNKILVGGNFINYAGTSGRSYLIRLNTDGTLDTAFCANAVDGNKFNSDVLSLAIQSDGKILVGGNFVNYAGTSGRNCLVRLNADGTLDTVFCNNAVDGAKFSFLVDRVVVGNDQNILICGRFFDYGGVPGRNFLLQLDSAGIVDNVFCVNAVDGEKFGNIDDFGFVNVAIYDDDGYIYVGGVFNNYNGVAGRNHLLKLNADGTPEVSFCSNAVDGGKIVSLGVSESVRDIAISGRVLYFGGEFYNYDGHIARSKLLGLDTYGVLNSTFNSNAVDGPKIQGSEEYGIYSCASNGEKIVIGGTFTSYAGVSGRSRVVMFDSDGDVDTIFCTNAVDGNLFNGNVNCFSFQSDGKIIFGGDFTNYKNVDRNRLIRLNSDGTLDTDFCTNAVDGTKFNNSIRFIAVQSNNKILVGGSFTNYAGTSGRNYLIRLNSDGTLDTDFCSNAVDGTKFSSTIRVISIQSDGKILIGGDFNSYNAESNRSKLIRLNSDGTLDTTFCANAVDGTKFNSTVRVIVIQEDGKILVGGNFTSYAGTSGRDRLVRLNSDGTLDTDFCTNAVDGSKFNAEVLSVSVLVGGYIYILGNFTNYDSSGVDGLIRLDSSGNHEISFDRGLPSFDGGCLFTFNNNVLVGGIFYAKDYPNVGKASYFAVYPTSNNNDVLISSLAYNVRKQINYFPENEGLIFDFASRVGEDSGLYLEMDTSGNILYSVEDHPLYRGENSAEVIILPNRVAGGYFNSVTKEVNSNYSVLVKDIEASCVHLLDGSINTVDVTLPGITSSVINNVYGLKCIDLSNTVKVLPGGTSTIDSVSGYTFSAKKYLKVKAKDINSWIIVSDF